MFVAQFFEHDSDCGLPVDLSALHGVLDQSFSCGRIENALFQLTFECRERFCGRARVVNDWDAGRAAKYPFDPVSATEVPRNGEKDGNKSRAC